MILYFLSSSLLAQDVAFIGLRDVDLAEKLVSFLRNPPERNWEINMYLNIYIYIYLYSYNHVHII